MIKPTNPGRNNRGAPGSVKGVKRETKRYSIATTLAWSSDRITGRDNINIAERVETANAQKKWELDEVTTARNDGQRSVSNTINLLVCEYFEALGDKPLVLISDCTWRRNDEKRITGRIARSQQSSRCYVRGLGRNVNGKVGWHKKGTVNNLTPIIWVFNTIKSSSRDRSDTI